MASDGLRERAAGGSRSSTVACRVQFISHVAWQKSIVCLGYGDLRKQRVIAICFLPDIAITNSVLDNSPRDTLRTTWRGKVC